MRGGWRARYGAALVALSAAVYVFHYFVFRDLHHILIFLVEDVAFVFLEVLLVTLLLHEILARREMREKMEKLNTLIGGFFGELGTEFLGVLSDADPGLDSVRSELMVEEDWTEEDFRRVDEWLNEHDCSLDAEDLDLERVRDLLLGNRDLTLRLMENPNLIEYDPFTELLRAVNHLTEELEHRGDLSELPDSDVDHIEGDAERAYNLLTREWLCYMEHLKDEYPYLFSLAMRTNPFDEESTAVVT